jgi:hypothetical protein
MPFVWCAVGAHKNTALPTRPNPLLVGMFPLTRAAGRGGASYELKKETNAHGHAEKKGNGEYGDGGILRFLKKLIPDVHAI